MRQDLVTSAVDFLNDPKVASASLAKRVEFLESKQLTPDEIEEALRLANEPRPINQNVPASYYPVQPPPVPARDWRDYFIMATVSAGLGYGLYEVARRYVLPLIVPPTPPELEADKQALEDEFRRVEETLAEMKLDADKIRSAEDLRQSQFQDMVEQVHDTLEQVTAQAKQREADMKLVKAQVDSIRESLPRSLDRHRTLQDEALNGLREELKSLQALLDTRLSRRAIPPVSVVADGTGTGIKEKGVKEKETKEKEPSSEDKPSPARIPQWQLNANN